LVKRISLALTLALALSLGAAPADGKQRQRKAKATVKFSAKKPRKAAHRRESLKQVDAADEGPGYCREVQSPSSGHLIIECAG
jgi:hypothetical protein